MTNTAGSSIETGSSTTGNGNPATFHFTLPPAGRPGFSSLKEELHPAFGWLTKNRARSRKRDVFESIDTIVIHATAGYATEHAVDTWKARKASAHWIIPDENEVGHGHFIWATVAEAKAAYHVGNVDYASILGDGPNVNDRSLGVELVNTQNVQYYRDPYSRWQIDMLARIVLYAWAKYPNLKHVISHAKLDPTRRTDPGENFPWEEFKHKVLTHSMPAQHHALALATDTPPISSDSERVNLAVTKRAGHCCEP
ncbi:N-acetylmuramoyl-L-alanine amidase [uncultured Shewanella sp.]|uniref:N-acetylmuramoyl-L-alanine amidase n=1 Tax=uncultured Shewanella sp. TaxID=173975 RepID=UPI00260B3055|nr:N-acetylmuramoyl-L-alanine amidase [uncultured Shewanella sp.]